MRGLLINSDHVASFGPQGIKQEALNRELVKHSLANRISEYASHQVKASELVGSGVLVAPTGSGKTEAALLWAARQAESGSRGRMYFLLPYQASMNAMQKRLVGVFSPKVADRPEAWSAEVSLVHGRSLRTLYERLLDQGYGPREAAQAAAEQNDLARLQTAPISVSSPFQLIRLLFAPRGVEALLVAFWESRLVLDEIHAYDVEVSALTLATLRFLVEELGARALVMTATLPKHLETAIQETQRRMPTIRPDRDVTGQPPRHRLRLLPFDSQSEDAERLILAQAKKGSVLVVVNQVRRARQLYERLTAKSPYVKLLHSRFTYADRAEREKEIAPEPGRILVATQAVEVSLDLSYNCCYSELAPLESLMQRFGRCNRRGETGSAAEVGVFEAFPANGNAAELPYEREHLAGVRKVLRRFLANYAAGEIAEGQVSDLVNESYPEQLRMALQHKVTQREAEIRASLIDAFEPWGIGDMGSVRRLANEWEKLFDGEEVLPADLEPRAAQEENWIGRTRYLVPISHRQFRRLEREGRIGRSEEMNCAVAEVAYDRKTGLEL